MADTAQTRATTGAVFISYASQDAASARRVCDALRDAGIEVWFDQIELVGGDAWDHGIRKQIGECALFIPILSAATQARREAYFRLEWKLADERTHLMAEGTPFLLPVTIDETDERGALVPKSFLAVQWTKLPRGEVSEAFCSRVAKLLDGQMAPEIGGETRERAGNEVPARTFSSKSRRPAWPWVALAVIGGAVIAGVAIWPKTSPVNSSKRSVALPSPAPPAVSEKSIAILPFENMSDDKENAYFADGIQEDILTGLAQIGDLNVISRTSVMGYRNTTKSSQQIAGELGVAYVMEGSVRRSGKRVRVTGQLIDGRTGLHVWARSYDRDLDDIFAIQTALSKEIAEGLHSVLSPKDLARLESRPTSSAEAYDLFLQGRAIYYTDDSWPNKGARARPLFERAVALDPKFADAWLELDFIYRQALSDRPSPADVSKANAALETAIRIEPDSPKVLYRQLFYADGRGDTAVASEIKKRITIENPNEALGFQIDDAMDSDNAELAGALIEKKRALDPRNGDALQGFGSAYLNMRKYSEAEAMFSAMVALRPPSTWNSFLLAVVPFMARGDGAQIEALLSTLPPEALRTDPMAISLQADWDFWKGDAAGLIDLWKKSGPNWIFIIFSHRMDRTSVAQAYISMGKAELARPLLEQNRDELLVRIESNPGDFGALSDLTLIHAMLGETAAARNTAAAALKIDPTAAEDIDMDLIWSGEQADKDAAIASLAKTLRKKISYVWHTNVHVMAHDIRLWPLQNDPRFQALLNDPKNNAPAY